MSLSITYEQIETELLQQGREEGRKEGREEVRAIARAMLQEGMTPEQVARLTKLAIDELSLLQN